MVFTVIKCASIQMKYEQNQLFVTVVSELIELEYAVCMLNLSACACAK